MPRIPDELLERIKAEVSVEGLAERRGVELKRHGADLIGLCPFHDDKEPSLVVTPGKNLWHCLGACQTGGSPIDWVMKAEGISFRHAVEVLLADHFPLDARRPEASPPPKRSTVRTLALPVEPEAGDEEVLRQVVAYYHQTLKESPEALGYLQRRGLVHPELVDRFHLGYSNRTLGLRIPLMNRRSGFEVRTRLQKLGLFRDSGHEHFVGSLVVPVVDEAGNVTEIYGRKVRDDLKPGTPLHLYLPGPHRGVFNAEGLRGQKEVVLCEALIDALTFWCAGFRNVTASYGVEGFTADHLALFAREGVEHVLIAYDRDEAGERAAEALSRKLIASGIGCSRVLFPKGMDASEYALKVQPPTKSLGVLQRSAEWMGGPTRASHAGTTAPAHEPPTPSAAMSTKAAKEPERTAAKEGDGTGREDEEALEAFGASRTLRFPQGGPHSDPISRATEPHVEPSWALPEASAPPARVTTQSSTIPTTSTTATATPGPPLDLTSDDEAVFRFEDRVYGVRGLKKALQGSALRLVVKAERKSEIFAEPSALSGCFLEDLNLVSSLARSRFEKQAAQEMGVKPEVVKWDLGQVLRRLEELQRQARDEALRPKPLVPPMTDEERAEALEYASAEDLVEKVLADFDRSGVVGEVTNKLVGYLGGVSRLSRKPLAIIIRSSSAAGKTALMDSILRFIPKESREKYSALSGHALFYFEGKDFKHKVLAIVEEEGAQRASYALKLLQSDGEITIASTGKDPGTGRLVTKEYRVEGPVMIFLCSTHVDIDEELLNRAVVLTVDEGREQTRAIHRLQREGQTLEGLWAEEEREEIYARHFLFQRLLRPLPVVNPYVRELTFLDEKTRTRRDHTKYLGLIEASALLHQYQRVRKTDTKRGKTKEYVEVDLFDVALANRLAAEVLGRTLDELGPQTRRLLMLLDEMVSKACEEHGIERSDFRFSRRDVRDFTGWGDTQVRVHLDRLVSLEYVLSLRGGRGQTFVYELLYDGQGKDGTPFLIGLADVEVLAKAHGLPVPRQVLSPLVRPDEVSDEVSEPVPTTPTSRGNPATSRGHRGAIAPLPRGGRGVEEPAPRAAPEPVFAETAENAHGGVGAESYAQGGRSDTTGARRPRFNLLRFPPAARRREENATSAEPTAPAAGTLTAPPPPTATPAADDAPAPVLALPKPSGNGKKPHGRLLLRRAASSFSSRRPQPLRGA